MRANSIGALLGDAQREAIFCGDDLICMGAMDGSREAGRVGPSN